MLWKRGVTELNLYPKSRPWGINEDKKTAKNSYAEILLGGIVRVYIDSNNITQHISLN